MGMKGKKLKWSMGLPLALLGGALVVGGLYSQVEAKKGVTSPVEKADVQTCYGCHSEIKDLHATSKHKNLNCNVCHSNFGKHLENPMENKPITRLEHAVCGQCHKDQYETFVSVNLASPAKIEKATSTSRSPLFDNLMRPHGFTREHAEPRSHIFALVDHLLVDRAYGGRFQLKDWTMLFNAKAAEKSAWEVLKDADPASSDQKIFPPYTPRTAATAANPVCLQCKTTDFILKWAYMGDKHPKAKWDRTSKVVEMARDAHRTFACVHCHDPHAAKHRVVRDALIEAIVDRGKGTYPYDPEKSKKVTVQKIVFRDFRAIGILNKADANIMCAQCHVEYNCNPGFDPKTGQAIPMADRRTNFFPWVNVMDIEKVYDEIGFRDFKHEITGAPLIKLQHPEVETFWGSKHERAGVTCADCHMPKVKNKQGKIYTFHGQRSVKYVPGRTAVCVNCHKYWTPEQAEYVISGIQNYIRGKMRKAEFWISKLVDTYAQAQAVGVSEEVLAQARQKHAQAHHYWEWWTAENSDGFHNPELATASLNKAIQLANDGVLLLEKAIKEKRTSGK
ncbi:cytochrome C [Caldimicrobium thiodismutans]|uniref:nitrite reductase (cytochrome; ammonia-forming) n=1 Tax=Caldimicrobium thiodismutans TaxID=1653476 RepID=A0A0U5AYI4_9BACT|nr:ammonia-forming cytochrome c nitrite reductase subunit c552 [Caldimicrobium thiodismutans]BAU23742.1 cytochrome C [Caldimicrobium thiodismutans]